jgi:N-acetylglutamate synthase-like GNAT family acetyltransferase
MSEATKDPSRGVFIETVPKSSLQDLMPLIRLADEKDDVIYETIENEVDEILVAKEEKDGPAIGLATLEWRDNESEIVHLAVSEDHQRRGIGAMLVKYVADESRKRGKTTLYVGTADCAISNIRFYLKQGFRMCRVERDFFMKRYGWKKDEEILVEDGIKMRDMILFDMQLR